jgi:hypothetical protein
MSTRLLQIVSFANVAPAVTVVLPHQINVNDIPEVPDFVAGDANGFTIAVTTTTVSVTNNNATPASVNVWLELKHSIPRQLGALPDLTPRPFIASGGAPASSGGGPSTVVEYLEEFINVNGFLVASDAGGAPTPQLTSVPGTRMVGVAQLSVNSPPQGVSLNLSSGGANLAQFLCQLGLGVYTFEAIALLDLVPTGIDDYTVRLTTSNTITSGAGNGTCLAFTAGTAENGNANWWGALNAATKVDTGIPVDDTNPHRFTIVYTPSVGVRWFIDGVSVAFIAGNPPINGQSAFVGANLKSIGVNGDPTLLIDYLYLKYEITRP